MNLIQRLYIRLIQNLSVDGLSGCKSYSKVDDLMKTIRPMDKDDLYVV